MNLFVLDTDILTLLLHGQANVSTKVLDHDSNELAITIITVEETLTGWYSQIRRSKKDDQRIRAYQALQQAVEFMGRIRILPFKDEALERFSQLRASKVRVGANDLRIAATILVHEGTLITRNLRDFKKVPDLQIEDWS